MLLIGTVLSSFFSSIQSTLTRVMDPNEYDNLLATLVASFSNINSEIIVISLFVLAAITPELEHRKSGYVERKRRPYQGNVVRIA